MKLLCAPFICCALVLVGSTALLAGRPGNKKTPAELRREYLAGLISDPVAIQQPTTTGSLWVPGGPLNEGAADYKAHAVNDLVTVVASVQTTASQSGTVDSGRNFSTNSAVTGVGGIVPAATNPLLAANSTTALKGNGATASNTAFATSLAGHVIAVLPGGNLVIEARSQLEMNNQREEVIIRGVARPGDITPSNTIASTSLSSLEIELKGKGVIANSVRPPNAITRTILRLIGF